MKKYYCDGCEKELSKKEREKNSIRVLNMKGLVIDEMDLCDGCNKEIWDAVNKVTHREE